MEKKHCNVLSPAMNNTLDTYSKIYWNDRSIEQTENNSQLFQVELQAATHQWYDMERFMDWMWISDGTTCLFNGDRSGLIVSRFQSVYFVFLSLSNFFWWITVIPFVPKKRKTVRHIQLKAQGGESHHWCDSQVLKARYSNQHRVAPLSSKQERSRSQEGQLSSLNQPVQRAAVFSAQVHITVTMLSPNTVLLSKISARVLKVSNLCPGRICERRPDD